MSGKRKKIIGFIVRLLVVCIILGAVAKQIDFKETTRIIVTASPVFLLVSYGLFMLNRILTAVKWNILLKSSNLRPGILTLIRITLESSFLGFVIPSGADIVRLVQLGKREKNITASTSSILADRMIAVAALGLLSILASIIGWTLIEEKNLLIYIMAAGAFLVLAVLVVMGSFSFKVYSKIHDIIFSIIKRQNSPFSTKLKSKIEEIHGSFEVILKTPSIFFAALVMNIVVQLIRVAQIHFLFKAGGMDVPIVFEVAFVPIITMITLVCPLMGAGFKEAAFMFFFGRIGVSNELSVAVSLLSHVIVIAGLLPGALLFFIGPDRKKIREEDNQ